MKLIAELAGTQYALALTRAGAQVHADVAGRRYDDVTVHEPEPGIYLLQWQGRVYECRVAQASAAAAGPLTVQVGQQTFQLTLLDPKQLRPVAAGDTQHAGRAQLTAAMPGKVVRVLVEPGAQVEAGAALVVVEAMKMQNELKAPKAGTVVELHAQPGATVNAGDVLVVVE